MTTLPFMLFGKKQDTEWLLNAVFKINNELTIPMKIHRIKEEENKAKDRWEYSVEVEECLDPKEWDHAVTLFVLGYRTMHDRLGK